MKHSNEYNLDRPVSAMAVTDIISCRDFSRFQELTDFCTKFEKYGKKGTDFKSITAKSGDSFCMPLKKYRKVSLQNSLKAIHSYPDNYRIQYKIPEGPFSNYLKRKRFFRCGVTVGSIGPGKDDPHRNLGYVYNISKEALDDYDEMIDNYQENIKTVFRSPFDNTCDSIMNLAELAITLMEKEKRWAQLREETIKIWDAIVIQIRRELGRKYQWRELRKGYFSFHKSEYLVDLVYILIQKLNLFYMGGQDDVNGAIAMHNIHRWFDDFLEDKPEAPKDDAKNMNLFIALVRFFQYNIDKHFVKLYEPREKEWI